MGFLYHDSSWGTLLWHGHLRHSPQAQASVNTLRRLGIQHNVVDMEGIAQDLHDTLYFQGDRAPKSEVPAWGSEIMEHLKTQLDFQILQARCQRRGLYAGYATEKLLPTVTHLAELAAYDATHQGTNQAAPQNGNEGAPGDTSAETERHTRKALRDAMHELDTIEEGLDGLEQVCGLQAGTDRGIHDESGAQVEAMREAWQLLKNNAMLKKLSDLAGRLTLMAHAEKRASVNAPKAGIRGLTRGGDLSRVLPQELVGLRSSLSVIQMHTIDRLLRKKALQYDNKHPQPEGKGPIILCVDESGSMWEDEKEVLASATALTLLGMARQQKRACWHIGFTGSIERQQCLTDIETLPALYQAIQPRSSGGTDFDPPLLAALAKLQDWPRADIVFLTDGEGTVESLTLDAVNAAKARGLTIHGIWLGRCLRRRTLAQFADTIHHVSTGRDAHGMALALVELTL